MSNYILSANPPSNILTLQILNGSILISSVNPSVNPSTIKSNNVTPRTLQVQNGSVFISPINNPSNNVIPKTLQVQNGSVSISPINNPCIEEPKIQLYPHQIDSLNFIYDKEANGPLRGGIISLKMGMGKTSVILELIDRERINKSDTKTLVVCSKTVMGEWINERNKFFPHLNMLIYHKEYFKDYNNLTIEMINNYDIIITTYDVIAIIDRTKLYSNDILILGTEGMHKDKIIGFKQKTKPGYPQEEYGPHNLFCYKWKRIVTDESQKFCNNKTKIFRAICAIYSDYRWCLTGTPIRNDDKDMWSLLFFCGLENPDNPKDWKFKLFEKYKHLVFVKKYEQTTIKMPKMIEHIENITFNPTEYAIYEYYLLELWTAYDRFIRKDGQFAGENGFSILLGLFTRLRQICIAPYLITNESKRKQEFQSTNLKEKMPDLEELVHNKNLCGFQSSKIKRICEIVQTIPHSEKIIIFSSFNSCLDLIHDALKNMFNIIIVDGDTTGRVRSNRLNQFRNDPNIKILLCNLRVGSEGLNLTQANHVICVELWWSPVPISQAISRCLRVGQTKDVHVYTVMIDKSIEENMNMICTAKQAICDSYLSGEESKRVNKPKLDKHTLGQIIGYYKMEKPIIRSNIINI